MYLVAWSSPALSLKTISLVRPCFFVECRAPALWRSKKQVGLQIVGVFQTEFHSARYELRSDRRRRNPQFRATFSHCYALRGTQHNLRSTTLPTATTPFVMPTS